jgi:hypothetical protein
MKRAQHRQRQNTGQQKHHAASSRRERLTKHPRLDVADVEVRREDSEEKCNDMECRERKTYWTAEDADLNENSPVS